MKTLTVRLPEEVVAEIEAESIERHLTKSDIVRERLTASGPGGRPLTILPDAIADLVGSVDGLPADLSSRTKEYLRETGYGRRRSR